MSTTTAVPEHSCSFPGYAFCPICGNTLIPGADQTLFKLEEMLKRAKWDKTQLIEQIAQMRESLTNFERSSKDELAKAEAKITELQEAIVWRRKNNLH